MTWFTISNNDGSIDVEKSDIEPIPIGYTRVHSQHVGTFTIIPNSIYVEPWSTPDGHEALFAMKEFNQRMIDCIINYEESITDGNGSIFIPFRARRFDSVTLLESFIKSYWVEAESNQIETYQNPKNK